MVPGACRTSALDWIAARLPGGIRYTLGQAAALLLEL